MDIQKFHKEEGGPSGAWGKHLRKRIKWGGLPKKQKLEAVGS